MAVRQIAWALADTVVEPVIAVGSAALLKTAAWVALDVVLPCLAWAAVFIWIALADLIGGPLISWAAIV